MTRDIDYQISVMQAFKEGKRIECKLKFESGKDWETVETPYWDWIRSDYRVKEEPKYVPYENTEELIKDFCKRSRAKRSPMGEPFIWVKSKTHKSKCLITEYRNDHVELQTCDYSLKEMFKCFTYLDGSPCGKKVEE